MARRSNRQSRRSRKTSDQVEVSSRGRGGSDFNPDYSYVIKDLRRTLLYAGIILAILVVLSFIF